MTDTEFTLPSSERLDQAYDNHPFIDVINEFYKNYDGSPEMLDKIHDKLLQHPAMVELRQALEAAPAYTTVFEYDPLSVTTSGDRGGCFGYDQSYGAKTAFLRVFEHIRPDDVVVTRSNDEVMVMIDHPSTVLLNGHPKTDLDEPTVLFTSRQLEDFGLTTSPKDVKKIGLIITHGDDLTHAAPSIDLIPIHMQVAYFGLAKKISSR